MGILFLFLFTLSFLLSLCGVFLFSKLALRRRLLLSPGGVPVTGGLAIALVFGLMAFFFSSSYPGLFGLFIPVISAAAAAFLTGLWDDYREMSIAGKIASQLFAAGLLVFMGVRTHIVFLDYYGNAAVTIIWVIAITNAFNLLDIMDGLCAAITLIVAFALFIICVLNGQYMSAVLFVILIGAVSGFLTLNLPPAKVYMGNSGSHFLGFVLAALSISVSYASASRQAALISPVFIMGFPIFDTLFVSFMRMKQGRSAVKKSKDHLALRFLTLGHSRDNALIFMSGLAFFFTFSGVLLSQVSNNAAVWIISAVLISAFILTARMNKVRING